MQQNHNIKSILFDLDGTVLDTAPDLALALSRLRARFGLPEVTADDIRFYAGIGALPLIREFIGDKADDVSEQTLRSDYLALYQACLSDTTIYFDGMESVLSCLDANNVPWGIVTNKPTFLTTPLLDAFGILERAGVIVCGDTLPKTKPDPAPLLHASDSMNINPETTLYVGDSINDVLAANRAGMTSCLAAYGYLPDDADIGTWEAKTIINSPDELYDIIRLTRQHD